LNDIHVTSGRLSSIDEFNPAMDGSGWELDFRQLNRGAGAADMDACATDSAALLRVNFSSRIHQQGCPPQGLVIFGVPIVAQAPLKLIDRQVESESILCFDSDIGMDFVSEAGFGAYTLSFECERLAELAQLLESPELTNSGIIPGESKYPDSARLACLRSALDEIFTQMLQLDLSEMARTRLIAALESELPLMVLQVWSDSSSESGISVSKRSRALRRAMDYIHSHLQGRYTIEDLCRESACSLSTLERAFGEHFGVSPKQYINGLRLCGVHRVLLNMEEFHSIGDIAADWGFWHMSKFAADYNRMFGELPSQTRNKRQYLIT